MMRNTFDLLKRYLVCLCERATEDSSFFYGKFHNEVTNLMYFAEDNLSDEELADFKLYAKSTLTKVPEVYVNRSKGFHLKFDEMLKDLSND